MSSDGWHACQIRNLYLSAQEPVNETNFLRRMLHGDYSERQIREERSGSPTEKRNVHDYIVIQSCRRTG